LLVLQFSDSLPAVIAFIVASRGIVAAIYLLFCLKILPALAKRFCVDIVLLRPLIGFGGWATASNLVAPVINLIDRFLIAAIISMTAVAYYVTPYEVVTKLWIFSASLMGAMFPVFSGLAVHRQHEIRDLGIRAFQYLLFFVSPIVGVLITFARELLTAWISAEFGYYSAAVAKWLAFGVLVNVLAQVPYTILMSTGRARTVAKLQLAELPIYFAMVWYMVGHLGQAGAAMAWTVRACLDALIMGLVADKMLPAPETRRLSRSTVYKAMVIAVFLVLCFALDSALRTSPVLKALVFIPSLTLFVVWEWTILLGHAEHQQMLTWFYRMIGARR
jgi:O-antigen/teichoic acid export membrane protein